MINKDRIVPITRTDLLSFYAAVLRGIDPTIAVTNVQPVDGAINLAALSGMNIATEPVKGLVGTPANGVALYCCLDYDFKNPMTPVNDDEEFVANPGDIYFVGANEGQTMARELTSGRNFTVGSVE